MPAFYSELRMRDAMAAKALMFTCLTGSRTGEVLNAQWGEFDFVARLWTCPADRMKAGLEASACIASAAARYGAFGAYPRSAQIELGQLWPASHDRRTERIRFARRTPKGGAFDATKRDLRRQNA